MAALLLLVFAGTVSMSHGQTDEPRVLRVVYHNFEPFIFDRGGARPSGFSVGLIEEIGRRAGFEVRYIPASNPAAALTLLAANRADIHPDLVPTDERRRLAAFTREFTTARIAVFVDSETSPHQTLEDLADVPIHGVTGSRPLELLQQRGDVTTVEMSSNPELIEAFRTGEAGAIVSSEQGLRSSARAAGFAGRVRIVEPPLSEVGLAIAVRRSAPELLLELDRIVGEMIADGTIARLEQRWFGPSVPRQMSNLAGPLAVLIAGVALITVVVLVALSIRTRAIERRYLREMLNTIPKGVALFDHAGHIRVLNAPMRRMLGLDDMWKMPTNRFADPVAAVFNLSETARSDAVPSADASGIHDGVVCRLDDGRVFLVTLRDAAMNGGQTDRVVTFLDITEDDRRQREIARLSQLFRMIFDTASFGIVALDVDGRILSANPAARALLPLPSDPPPHPWPDEARFLQFESFQPLDESSDPIRRALAGHQLDGEVTLLKVPDLPGGMRYIRLSSAVARDGSTAVRAVLELIDVTDEEQLRQQNERRGRLDALGQLSGGIAHDFNNLLSTILYAVELAMKEPQSDKAKSLLETVIRSVDRGAATTSRLLTFASRQPGPRKVWPIAGVFSELEQLVRPMLEAGISLKVDVADTDLAAVCDSAQLEDALINLVLNARDAIRARGEPATGTISLQAKRFFQGEATSQAEQSGPAPEEANNETRPIRPREDPIAPGSYVVLSVTDNGVGMNDTLRRRALDPFFTTKSGAGGAGLGLSMVYGFAQQSDGVLRLYSDEGVGTTVRLFLPLGDIARDGAGQNRDAEVVPGDGEHIFLVEDEADLLVVVEHILIGIGYQVTVARSGAEALRILDEGLEPDLLLTDIVMPHGVSGFDLAREFRQRFPDRPVIFTSGYAGYSGREVEDLVGVVLPKPCMPGDLSAAIRASLGRGLPVD